MTPVMCRLVGQSRHPEIAEVVPLLGIYSGSTKGSCSRCSAHVWVGPRGQALVEAGVGEPLCVDCIIDDMVAARDRGEPQPFVLANLGNPERPGSESSRCEGTFTAYNVVMQNATITTRCESTGLAIEWDGLTAHDLPTGIRFEIAEAGGGTWYLLANGDPVSFSRDGISRNSTIHGARLDALEVLRHRLGLVRYW